MHDFTGIILAGGLSQRMGQDKFSLDFYGVPLLKNLADELAKTAREIYIVTKSPESLAAINLHHSIVTDVHPSRSAMAGIYTGLQSALYDHVFVLACDLPLFDHRVTTLMQSRLPQFDTIVPQTPGGLETLCAFYHKKHLPVIDSMIRDENYRLTDFLNQTKNLVLPASHFESAIYPDVFFNMNSPKDYSTALKLFKDRKNI